MVVELIFELIGGLGFFLYGIRTMSEGLRKVSSERLKNILSLLTRNRFIGLLVGTGVTALIQSSSAMTVMVVGFVNAGLMTLMQAIPVVIGANIGITPSNDGEIIRLPIPPLTEERRKDMVKLAKKIVEEGRVAIRNIRREANESLKKMEKSGDLPEDDSRREQAEVQELTDEYIKKIDEMFNIKEKEIMEI